MKIWSKRVWYESLQLISIRIMLHKWDRGSLFILISLNVGSVSGELSEVCTGDGVISKSQGVGGWNQSSSCCPGNVA